MRLVYLSPVPWDSFAQRPHKFVEWFHDRTGAPVLWIDPYPTRFPHWRDFRRSRQVVATGQDRSTPPWLAVVKPGGLPIEPMPGSAWINGRFWRECLTQVDDFARKSETLLTIGKPSNLALKLLTLLHSCRSVYDAMDDFPSFYTGFSRIALARRERQVARLVDVIWASSSELKSRWGAIHRDVRLVHNGLDQSALDKVEPQTKPTDRKVFGYVGTIASWFDWGWVCALAEARPSDEIRLIGPISRQPDIPLPKNITLSPACDHAAALTAMTRFHVGLIPFKKNALTASVDPIKYYEYRAFGLPVISTNFGEMCLRGGEQGVFISHSVNDVGASAQNSIQYQYIQGDAEAFSAQNTWARRFDAAGLFS